MRYDEETIKALTLVQRALNTIPKRHLGFDGVADTYALASIVDGLVSKHYAQAPALVPVKVKPRKRAGSWDSFAERYEPIPAQDGAMCRHYTDGEVRAADDRLVWTVVDGDNGNTYVVPGFATVNYVARVLCKRPWSDVEFSNPGYVW